MRKTACSALIVTVMLAAMSSTAPTCRGQEPEKVVAAAMASELKAIVLKHYPKATFEVEDNKITFAFNTRKFMIHEALLTGEWQDAYEDVGPQKGGIVGTISVQAGDYRGMAAVPQTFDKRYFKVLLLAPYSKDRNQHLLIHLKVPANVSQEFMKDFQDRLEAFSRK